jgi:hypothetical protein
MPYANPTPLFLDFSHSNTADVVRVNEPHGLDRPGALIPGFELVWDHALFPDDLSGRCILLKLGLTFPMIEFSDERARIRFVITKEITGPHGQATQREAQIARGDACATPSKSTSFSFAQFYGPIEPLQPGQLMTLRARVASLDGTAEIAAGVLGTNEFRAEVFRVE